MGPLSQDLRERVVAAATEGRMTCRAAARRFGVSFASAIRWVSSFRKTGDFAAKPMGGDRRSGRVEAHADYLLRLNRRKPDLTLVEIRDRLELVRDEKVSPSMIWRFFDRHDITLKKKSAHASEQDRSDVLQRRREWFAGQLDLDPVKLVFVDETGAATNMARRYGRRRRGERLRCGVPHGHYKAVTFICGLRLRGVVAPKAYDRAMTADTFETWLEQCLLPTLEEGDVIIVDNLKAHKNPRVAEILAKKNCTVEYLPQYSPDFNPIEKAFSKLKSVLRKLAERTVAGLFTILEGCADRFTSKECENYFIACGYDST